MALLARIAERLGHQLDAGTPLGRVPYPWALLPLRNLMFLAIVLAHGLRRLLPPF